MCEAESSTTLSGMVVVIVGHENVSEISTQATNIVSHHPI